MEFTDRILKCNDCGSEFTFTAGEQLFFYDKQFKNDPKHCKQCKAKRLRGTQRVRSETRTTCSECNEETTVPFKPTQGRPVLCRSCFQKQGARAAAAETEQTPASAEPMPVPAASVTEAVFAMDQAEEPEAAVAASAEPEQTEEVSGFTLLDLDPLPEFG